MKTDVQNLSTTRVKIVVEIPFVELGDDLKEAYRSIASQVNIPGFRKGKVPARIIDQRFGRGTVLSEVANAVIPRTYDKVVAEAELVPLGQPQVEVTKLEDGEFLEFVAEVDVRPEFDVPAVDGVSVEVDAVAVTEDAVAEELENLRKRFAALTEVQRPAAAGDVVLVDVSATDADGNTIEPYSASALSYEVGSGSAIEGFDAAVEGAAVEEERTFEYTPADGEFAGVPLTITLRVTAVRERELPEADDDFAMLASEFDTIEELLADLRNRLQRTALFQLAAQARAKVRDAFLALVDFDLPEQFIKEQVDEHFADGHGDEAHRADHEAEVRETLKANLLLDKLAEEQQVRVEESELTQWLITQASRYGMTPDDFANALVSGGQVQAAIAEVRRAKALSLVVDAATITDSEGNTVDLDELARTLSAAADEIDEELEEEFEEELDEIFEEIEEAIEIAIEEAIEEAVEELADEDLEILQEPLDEAVEEKPAKAAGDED